MAKPFSSKRDRAHTLGHVHKYFHTYVELAKRFGTGLILESATWRSNPDWGVRLGYSREALAEANARAIELLKDVRQEYEPDETPVVISGCIGPRGDGYVPANVMSAEEAESYHREQIEVFAHSGQTWSPRSP